MKHNEKASARIRRSIRTLEKLSHFNDRPSTVRAARIMNALKAVAPDIVTKLYTAPMSANVEKASKARSIALNHSMEERAERRAYFADVEYTLAKKVVAGKISGAARRGMTDNNNPFLHNYELYVQEAALSLEESFVEALVYASTVPAEYERDFWEDHDTPFLVACRACGRLERKLSARAAKNTPLEYVSNKAVTSKQERIIADQDAVRDWKTRVIQLIEERERMHKLTAKQTENMLHKMSGNAEKVKCVDAVRRFMVKMLLKAGLLRMNHGTLEMVTD